MMFFKPSAYLSRVYATRSQIIIFDTQVRVLLKLFHDSLNVLRGFSKFLHGLAHLTRPVSMLDGLLGA
jgi:hypothetical protein